MPVLLAVFFHILYSVDLSAAWEPAKNRAKRSKFSATGRGAWRCERVLPWRSKDDQIKTSPFEKSDDFAGAARRHRVQGAEI